MAKKTNKLGKFTVAGNTEIGKVVDVRRSIKERLEAIGKTRNWLADESGLRQATVYDYLAGKTDVLSDKAEKMLAALGLEIRPAGRGRKKT